MEETLEQLAKKNWIAEATKNAGGLRKALGVKKGEKIPAKELKISKDDSPLMKKRKTLAKTLAKFR